MKNLWPMGSYEVIQTALLKRSGMSKHTVIRIELEKILDEIDKQIDEVLLGNL